MCFVVGSRYASADRQSPYELFGTSEDSRHFSTTCGDVREVVRAWKPSLESSYSYASTAAGTRKSTCLPILNSYPRKSLPLH